MRNNWLFFIDLDGSSRDIFPIEPLVLHNYGGNLFAQISSFVDNSIYQSRNLYAPGSLALREAFNCVSKLAGALLFWISSTSTSNLTQDIASSSHGSETKSCASSTQVKHIISSRHNLAGFRFVRSKGKSAPPVCFDKISSFMMKLMSREAKRLQSYPLLSLAAALVPPLDNLWVVIVHSLSRLSCTFLFWSVFDVSLILETCFCVDCHQIFRGISCSIGEYWCTSEWIYGSKALWGWESKMLWSIISWLDLDKTCSWAQNWHWVSYDSGQHFSWREEFQFKFRGNIYWNPNRQFFFSISVTFFYTNYKLCTLIYNSCFNFTYQKKFLFQFGYLLIYSVFVLVIYLLLIFYFYFYENDLIFIGAILKL